MNASSKQSTGFGVSGLFSPIHQISMPFSRRFVSCSLLVMFSTLGCSDLKHLTGGSIKTPFQSIASNLPRKARDERQGGRPPPSLGLPFHFDQAPPSPELYSAEFPCKGGKRACAAGAASLSGGHAGMLEGTMIYG